MTSTPELHLDIVNLIIDELRGFRPDLKTCALVCRSWVLQSRFYLFSTIRLGNCQNHVSSFLALCASPYSTIPLARISNLNIATNTRIKEQLQNTVEVLDQLLTWRSPYDGKSIVDVFRHLKTLSLDWIQWGPLSQTARSMLPFAFQTVTELKMQLNVFKTGDEFLEFLSSLTCLETLCLDNVIVHRPAQSSTIQSNVFPPRFHTINLKNIHPYHSPPAIRALTPCHSLKNLSIHAVNFGEMDANVSMAIGDLLVSAGPSLGSFEFCVRTARTLRDDVDLNANPQHIDLTENPNLRNITLDVDAPAYLVLFLQRLTKSHYSPSLETLHIPRLVPWPERDSTPVDYQCIDQLLQHPYFSALSEFRCTQCVISGKPEDGFDQPDVGTQPLKEMELKIEELKGKMPKLADRGILQVDKYFRSA